MHYPNPFPNKYVTVQDLVAESGLSLIRLRQVLAELQIKPADKIGTINLYPLDTGAKIAARNTLRGQCRRYHVPYIALAIRRMLRASASQLDKDNGHSYEFYTMTIIPALVKAASQFKPIGTRISNSGKLPAYSAADGVAIAKAAGWEITLA